MRGLYLVVSAPSGAGKTTIYKEFIKIFPEVRFSISHTTRKPRPGEVDGQDYHFVSPGRFRELIDLGEFIEWEENFGHLYGTSGRILKDYLEEGRDILLDIEPRGARKIKEMQDGGAFVLILPPSLAELEVRLRRRGEQEDVMRVRLGQALEQISQAHWYDYIVVNDFIPKSVELLKAIYLAEKCRRGREEAIAAYVKEGKGTLL